MKRYLPVLIIAILVLGCNSNKKQDSTSINETENKPATVSVENK